MTTDTLAFWIYGGFALFFSGEIALIYHLRSALDRRLATEKDPSWDDLKKRYLPVISPVMLPVFLTLFFPMTVLFRNWQWSLERLFCVLCSMLVEIWLFYLILTLLLPFLRRRYTSKVVGFLWILPNYLYLTQYAFMDLKRPLFRIAISQRTFLVILVLWLVLAGMYLAYGCLSHLRFRRNVLKESTVIHDPALEELWENIKEEVGMKEAYHLPLLCCKKVQTPLSLGLFPRTMKVLLPEGYVHFSQEELRLILTHEAIHVKRQDTLTKFFLWFCTALSPIKLFFRWCMKSCSEDLELSVDEEVTSSLTEEERKRYASLLLKNVGDDRGFTTSLSSDAKALKYRLSKVLHPEKKKSGTLLIAVMMLFLLMASNLISFYFPDGSLDEMVFDHQLSRGEAALSSSTHLTKGNTDRETWSCLDEEGLNRYLGSLSLGHVPGIITPLPDAEEMIFLYDTPEGMIGLAIQEETITVTRFGDLHSSKGQETYYVTGKVDLERVKGYFQKGF